MKKVILVLFAFLSGCSSLHKEDLTLEKDLSRTVVSIVSDGGGGGSGVVLVSNSSGSLVLTNRHICAAIAAGGVVTTVGGKKARVALFKPSKQHDLCLIKTNRDFGLSTNVSDREGTEFEKAFVVGHPNLMPEVAAPGHFSGFMDVEIMTGIEPCPTDEAELGKLGLQELLMCLMIGGRPKLETLESQVVSSLIAPGNSGSPVFNSNGEVVNLVFAGIGENLSHAITVPNGQIRAFLSSETKRLKWIKPDKSKVRRSAGLESLLPRARRVK